MRQDGFAVYVWDSAHGAYNPTPVAVFLWADFAENWAKKEYSDAYYIKPIEWIEVKSGLLYGIEPAKPPQVPLLP